MQNSGNFTIILVNYQFPRLVKPGAGNTQNVVNSYGIRTPLAGKIPQVHVISRISSISTDFGGKCVLGGKYAEFTKKGGLK